jgi:hypothetical protein
MQMKKVTYLLTALFFIIIPLTGCRKQNSSIGIIGGADGPTAIFITSRKNATAQKQWNIERIVSSSDKDQDGLNDTDDILEGARKDAENKPKYRDGYYNGGYPPEDEGVCTDVIWRAFKNAGYMLKELIDEDIQNHLDLYPRVEGKPDPNIDFRRIKNLRVFLNRYAVPLTTEIIPGDEDNLKQWQAGDIIVFDDPQEHIGILSDQRNAEGIPLMIHNCGPYTRENDMVLYWRDNLSPIIGHYRFPPDEPSENNGNQ